MFGYAIALARKRGMYSVKKFFCMTLVIIIVCLCTLGLSSCDLISLENNAGSSLGEKTAIVENGVAKYSIVYPQNAPMIISKAAYNFQSIIFNVTGINLPVTDDGNVTNDGSQKYILIGNTALPESAEIKATLANSIDPYAILKKGNNIVVVAKDNSALADAVRHYGEEFVSDYDKTANTLYFLGTDAILVPDFKGFDLTEISRYCIIYSQTPAGMRSAAKLLQDEIKEKTGVKLPIYSETERVCGLYEIIIGHTNRELSRDVYADNAHIMQCSVSVKGASLQMACGGTFSAKKCVEGFAEKFLLQGKTRLDEGEHANLYAELAPNNVPHTSGTTARIMTLNIMPDILGAQKYPNVLPVNDRAEILAGMLIQYTPDVIGLQETCAVWEKLIPYYLDVIQDSYGIDYDIVLNSYNELNNYTPIIYREDKYILDFAKYEPYDYERTPALKRGYYVRGASQIKVTERANGTTFIVVNSHWDHGSGTSKNPTHPERTQYCADGELAIINAYKEKYPDVRIFATGDFNSHRPHIAVIFEDFLEQVDGEIASELAKRDGTLLVTGGYHCNDNYKISEGVPREQISTHSNDFIDHIVGTNGNFKVLRHDTILVNYCHILTDHMPVYADIKFE